MAEMNEVNFVSTYDASSRIGTFRWGACSSCEKDREGGCDLKRAISKNGLMDSFTINLVVERGDIHCNGFKRKEKR